MSKHKWEMDAAHSEVQFKVRHLLVSWVTGSFLKFNATLDVNGEDMTTAEVKFTADAASISTNNEQRDQHLRSSDFFDVANHPQVTFQSTNIERSGPSEYEMTGILAMRGVSRSITLQVEFAGVIKDPRGGTRTGFTISGKVNRTDFGITFSRLAEAGEALLGEAVIINANAEFLLT